MTIEQESDPHTTDTSGTTANPEPDAVVWNSTPEQRRDRLAAILDGTTARGTAEGPRYLLLGAGLHAAAKSAAGGELSGLEAELAAALERLLPADELTEAAQMFTQAQTRAGGLAVFPASVARLPVTGTYDLADLETDLVALGEHVMSQPNSSQVKVADLVAGKPFDTAEFKAVMAEHHDAITVFTGPPTSPEVSLPPVRIDVDYHQFHCHAETGDGFFTNSDEICWMSASSTDGGFDTIYTSEKFESVDAGDQRDFPPNSRLFAGFATEAIIADIQCWESDIGGFWSEIRAELGGIADECAKAAVRVNQYGAEIAAALTGAAGAIAGLIGELLGWLIGNDDLIKQRTIAINRSAWESMLTHPDSWWFVGEGASIELKLNTKLGDPQATQLQHMSLAAGSTDWSPIQAMDYQVAAPALAAPWAGSPPERLHAFFLDAGTKVPYFLSMGEDGVWEDEPFQAGSSAMNYGGAAPLAFRSADGHDVVLGYYAAVMSGTNELRGVVYRPDTREFRAQGIPSRSPGLMRPAVVRGTDPEREYCVFLDRFEPELKAGNESWYSVTDTGAWTSAPPALAIFDGYVHCLLRGHGSSTQMWWMKRPVGPFGDFGGAVNISMAMFGITHYAPALAVFDNKLWCVYHDAYRKNLAWRTLDSSGGSWTMPESIPGTATDEGPGLAVHNNKIHLLFRRPL